MSMLSHYQIKTLASLKHKKYRDRENRFLIEGLHLLEECLSSSYNIELLLLRNDISLSPEMIAAINAGEIHSEYVTANVINKLSETKNPQGIVAVVNIPDKKRESGKSDIIIALDRVSDPGNAGTILRTAYWYNVHDVLLGSGSVDIYNSKVIRSAQGAVFHLNVRTGVDLISELSLLNGEGHRVLLLTPDGKNSISGINQKGRYVLVLGNEGEGVSPELIAAGYETVSIDRYSGCESLNVAVAFGIVLERIKRVSLNS